MQILFHLPFSCSAPGRVCFLKKINNVVKSIGGDPHENLRSDVIIVGAGVAGSALAHTLAKEGRMVHLIERDLREPDRVSGEILQPAGYLKLLELGLEDCIRDIDAQLLVGYAVYKDGKTIKIPYPLENYDNHVAGRSFHHGRFVQKLRHKAASHPKLEQGSATSLIEETGEIKGVRYKTGGGNELTAYASLTVVCDGCFSSLRKFLCKPKIKKSSHVACVTMEICEVPYPNYGHLIMGNPSCMSFYAYSSSQVRLMIDFPGTKLPPMANGEMARFLINVVAPQIPPEMYNALILAIEKGEIRTMPIRCMPAANCLTPGALLLGDAFNMRNYITGGGMTIALQDVALLSNLFTSLNLQDTSSLMKLTQHFYHIRKPMVFSMNVIADSLHKVLCASPDDKSRNEIQNAVFNYLSLRSNIVRGPFQLVSGLDCRPLSLFVHFFGAVIYLFGATLFPLPSSKKLYAAAQVAMDMAVSVIPMILNEGLSLRQACFATKASDTKPCISGKDES